MKIKIYFNWNTEEAWIYKGRLPQNIMDEPDEKLSIVQALKEYIDVPDSITIEKL